MPLDELARNSAPAIGGMLVAAAAFLYARSARRGPSQPKPDSHSAAHHPAE